MHFGDVQEADKSTRRVRGSGGMNFKLMMTLRSKYNQGLRTKETLEANRMYLKLRLNGLLKEAKLNITNRDKEQSQ